MITGLKMFTATSPFRGYMGTMLDLEGAWVAAMLEAHQDEPDRCGLAVWEGTCEVTTASDDELEYTFRGSWRPPTGEEMRRLAEGLTPLRGLPMPALIEEEQLEVEVSR